MGQNKTKLSPSVSLSDIFGQGLTLNPRPSFSDYGWLPKNPVKLDFLTGSPLTVAGDLPVIGNYSLVHGQVISLLEKANLEVVRFPLIYHTERDYKNLLSSFRGKKGKLVCNHIHPPDELDQNAYWMNPQLIAYLNNKGNLHKIAPSNQVPRRVTIPISDVKRAGHELMTFPLVIKAAVDQSTGGGFDVLICRNTTDIDHACSYFRKCQTVVAEEFVETDQIYNVQFAKAFDGRDIYLGASEQISDPSGHYLGNWIGSHLGPPNSVVKLGREIMASACRLGFFGIGGFDIAVSKDHRALAIDLNFRLNGSTPALLLANSIMQNYGSSVLLFRTWQAVMEWDRFLSICTELVESKYLIPISVYHAPSSPYSGSRPIISGLLIGSSKQDVLQKERILSELGLT